MRTALVIIEFAAAVFLLTFVLIGLWRSLTDRDKRMERKEANTAKLVAVAKSNRKIMDMKESIKKMDTPGGTAS